MKKGVQRAKYITTIQSHFLIAVEGIAGGKMLPVIILNEQDNGELRNIVSVHRTSKMTGDVLTTWGYTKKLFATKVSLHVSFVAPLELSIFVEFDIETDFHLIDQLIDVQAFHLFFPEKEERDIDDLQKNGILVEAHGDFEHWDKMYRKRCFNELKKGLGSGKEAKAHLDDYIKMKRSIHLGI